MPLFAVPNRPDKDTTTKLAKKSNTVKRKSTTNRVGKGIADIIHNINNLCEQKLGQYKDKYRVIRLEDDLRYYIDKCVENGVIAIDTETTGLDPMLDKIVGICLYTPNEKAVYVPINHENHITGVRTDNQLNEEQCRNILVKLIENDTKIIMFNADFDIRVLKNQIGLRVNCYFDCYLAARCLNENEESNRLKHLHQKYCLNGIGDAWTFGDLFDGITFNKVPIDSAYLYAARDAEITYELYQYQNQFLDINSDKCVGSLKGISNVFWNIEMPCLNPVIEMEDNGIEFDFDKQKELSTKYNKLLKDKEIECLEILKGYEDVINDYRIKHLNCKLDNPVNIGSPTQLAILLYDILRVEPPDSKSPRGTGEGILSKIDLPICKAILDYRTFSKLISTYIDKMPKCVNPNDGRIHCKFNQYGADTGRFSCNSPNLQNIPSHNKDIRKMFRATTFDKEFELNDNHIELDAWCEVETNNGWKYANKIVIGEEIKTIQNEFVIVKDIQKSQLSIEIYF